MIIEDGGPRKPEPKPVTLARNKTAIIVLDLSARCQDPRVFCSLLLPGVSEFLERARALAVPVIYTISLIHKGTPGGEPASSLKKRETEPVIHPNGFDKFTGGELDRLLKDKQTENLVIVGAATNMAVLYTATASARIYRYETIIPIDGVMAMTKYEQEYALHQLGALPPEVTVPIQFTKLGMIQFA